MEREFEGRLTKFVPSAKRITTAILTLECEVTAADYLDLARFYLQPGTCTLYAFQQELPLRSDGRQMSLDDAPVADDGSTAEVAAEDEKGWPLAASEEEAETIGWCCPICHQLRSAEAEMVCEVCAAKVRASLADEFTNAALQKAAAGEELTEDEMAAINQWLELDNPESERLEVLQAELEAENDARQEAEDEERPAPVDDGLIDFGSIPGPDKPCTSCAKLGSCDFKDCDELKAAVAATVADRPLD